MTFLFFFVQNCLRYTTESQMTRSVLFVRSWNELYERFSKVCEYPPASSAALRSLIILLIPRGVGHDDPQPVLHHLV